MLRAALLLHLWGFQWLATHTRRGFLLEKRLTWCRTFLALGPPLQLLLQAHRSLVKTSEMLLAERQKYYVILCSLHSTWPDRRRINIRLRRSSLTSASFRSGKRPISTPEFSLLDSHEDSALVGLLPFPFDITYINTMHCAPFSEKFDATLFWKGRHASRDLWWPRTALLS